MNDFSILEQNIVRELSCRLCLCTDVVKLKPFSSELKRKIKKLFDISIRSDDTLPKAVCHDCLQQVTALHLYTVKVEKTQKFLEFHRSKLEEKKDRQISNRQLHPLASSLYGEDPRKKPNNSNYRKSSNSDHRQGDTKRSRNKIPKKKSPSDMKFLEAMPLEEFAKIENVDKLLLNNASVLYKSPIDSGTKEKEESIKLQSLEKDIVDPIVLINGRPARTGSALDKQITLFYKMECCICHENSFQFKSLMKHYKERHGVPGYVTCCDKKFHYFYPKRIIEHMAHHLQPNIFMCTSCHQNFQTSNELQEHQTNGGRSNGKISCPRCSERYPTYRELGCHIVSHRLESDKFQCDYCGKTLKHHHRKKTVNNMENVILCSQCIRTLKNIEKQEKTDKDKTKVKNKLAVTMQRYQKFKQALGVSGDEETSTE
ncbi:hypothetical protein ACJJTC_007968 [Scirpophaga incertulas]